MTLWERLSALDRLQHGRTFKIIATCVIALAGVVGVGAYLLTRTQGSGLDLSAIPDQQAAKILEDMLGGRSDPTLMAVGIGLVTLMAIAVVWLGLCLTYLGLALAGAAIVVPLSMFGPTRGLAQLLAGVILLTFAFTALMQLLRLLLGGAGPVLSIAKTAVAEASRQRVSLVLMVILVFALAAIPMLLSDQTPLRYRVQAFLQYSTGGSFWIIGLLSAVFSAATVSFDQRDKIIWQTITKPVSAWQYILGKWLGVIGINLVLLLVCGSAVFLFTEYLRQQPAQGEREAYVSAAGGLSEDREVLETQVLSARVAVIASPPDIIPEAMDQTIEAKVEAEKRANAQYQDTPAKRAKMRADLTKVFGDMYRSIEPTKSELYVFDGLQGARGSSRPLTFRFRVNAGSNAPDQLYRLTMIISGSEPFVREVGLGNSQTVPLSPAAVDDEGRVTIEIFNGDITRGMPNPMTISFPPDGLELSYSDGSYRANFLRVMVVLWVKLAFISMIAIFASTFLSFPVACVVAVGALVAAELTPYLWNALDYYNSTDEKGNILPVAVVIRAVAVAIAGIFKLYGDLDPVASLVDGRRLSWDTVAQGVAYLAAVSGVLFVSAVAVLRRRELAIYSGHA